MSWTGRCIRVGCQHKDVPQKTQYIEFALRTDIMQPVEFSMIGNWCKVDDQKLLSDMEHLTRLQLKTSTSFCMHLSDMNDSSTPVHASCGAHKVASCSSAPELDGAHEVPFELIMKGEFLWDTP
jgi:hypothetical protein